jgi:hypothetical protein
MTSWLPSGCRPIVLASGDLAVMSTKYGVFGRVSFYDLTYLGPWIYFINAWSWARALELKAWN